MASSNGLQPDSKKPKPSNAKAKLLSPYGIQLSEQAERNEKRVSDPVAKCYQTCTHMCARNVVSQLIQF